MKTFFAEPKTASQAAFVARIVERAQTLTAEGYRIQQYGKSPVYAIFKPENTQATNGYRDYTVDLTPAKENCNCPAFEKYGDCKHRIAVQILRDEDAEWDRQAEEWADCRY